jgi:hypothetical protein
MVKPLKDVAEAVLRNPALVPNAKQMAITAADIQLAMGGRRPARGVR